MLIGSVRETRIFLPSKPVLVLLSPPTFPCGTCSNDGDDGDDEDGDDPDNNNNMMMIAASPGEYFKRTSPVLST